jgi:GH35 family endo-1,4-beta-xylanase
MIQQKISKASSLILLSLMAGSLPGMLHEPWELTGAAERIEEHRMGTRDLVITLPCGGPVPEGATYSIRQTRHAFNFGGSLAADWQVQGKSWYPEFKQRFARLFNYATVDFYWAVHEKKRGRWKHNPGSWEKLEWALGQGMTLKGHPLMWHEVVPGWIAGPDRPVEEIDADIRRHVRMLAGEYPMIDQWDTYNEGPGIYLKDEQHGMRRWMMAQGGPGPASGIVIEEARSVLPGGYFVLNHFSDRDRKFDDLITFLLENDIRFEAVGLQTHMHHLGDTYSEERLWRAMEKYSGHGVPLHLTEVSVPSCEPFADWPALSRWEDQIKAAKASGRKPPCKPGTADWERYQADLARDFYTLAFSHPGVEAIVWWTITDIEPWRGMPAGLIDTDGRPKPVYDVLDKLINEDWHTTSTGTLGKEGHLQLKGFHGSYTIEVRSGGRVFNASFDLVKGTSGPISLVLEQAE